MIKKKKRIASTSTSRMKSDVSQARCLDIYDSAQIGYVTLEKKGSILQANLTAAALLGAERGALVQQPLSCFILEEDQGQYELLCKQFTQSGEPQTCELRMVKSDGELFWAQMKSVAVLESGTLVNGIVLNDITTQKKSELKLQASKERYQRIVETAEEGVWSIDAASLTDYVNPKMAQMMGYKAEEMIGRPIDDFLDDEGRDMLVKLIKRRKGGISEQFEFKYVRKDGSKLWAFVSTNPISNASGVYVGAVALLTDISARREAEAALRESEAQFRAIFEQAAVGVAMIDSNTGRFLKVNQRYCNIARLTRRQMLTETFMDITHPDDLQADLDGMKMLKAGKISTFTMEKRYLQKDGTCTWVNLTVSPMWQPGEAPTRHIAVVEDITARKQVEMELARTADLLLRTGEMAKIGGWELELKTRSIFWSKETYRIHDVESLTTPSVEQAILFYSPEARPTIEAAVEVAINKGIPFDLELPVMTAKGRPIWVRAQGVPVLKGRKVVKLVGTFQDITQRKNAEAKYLRELEFNETLVNHTAAIIVLMDLQGHIEYVNQATINTLGYNRKELLGRALWEVGIMRPDEKVRSLERLQLLHKGGTNPPHETTLTAKSGQDYLFSLSSIATHSSDGTIDRIIVTGTDLTERNRMQREILKISEQEQARIGHNLHDGVGQTMTGVESLMEALESELGGEQRTSAARIRQLVQEAIQEVRRMSHSMSPTAVKNRGLGGVLQLLAETIRINHRTRCTFKMDPGIHIGDPEKETHIYRIAQEATSNALRHGKPTQITISLQHLGDRECLLKIEDNGSGINKAKSSEGIGLQVMDYRANIIGGTLKITSKPRRGVTVTCRFPCTNISAHKP